MINISIDISRKKKYNAIVKRNLTHQFQILSNSTLKLLKFHFPPISSSSSLYPLFFPYLNLPYFLPNIPSPFANFFTNSPLPSFFFFPLQFSLVPSSISLSPITILRTRTYATVDRYSLTSRLFEGVAHAS